MSERNKQIEAIQQAMMGAETKLKVADIMNIVNALNGVKDEEKADKKK